MERPETAGRKKQCRCQRDAEKQLNDDRFHWAAFQVAIRDEGEFSILSRNARISVATQLRP